MSRKCCWIIQHVAYEGPGLIGEVLETEGWEIVVVRLDEGDTLPAALPDDAGALVALGGPMSVHDAAEHPWLADEKRLLRQAIADDLPTLGICLGAQLIADVAGARVYRGLKPEIGWLPVALTDKGEDDPLFGQTLPRAFQPFHGHGDTFDLPRGAAHLAKSALYTRQAFRLGENVYALQFHLEVTTALLAAWNAYLPPEAAGEFPEKPLAALKPFATRFFATFLERTGAR